MSPSVGIDIGGTKIAVAVCDDASVLERVQVPTPRDADELVRSVTDAVTDLRTSYDVAAAGIGIAGFVAPDRSTVLFAPNLPWIEPHFAHQLSDGLGLPIVVENDANAAAWGEFRFGAGSGVDNQVLITVGTGIGGGLIIDGRLYRGAHGIAAEIGHLQVVEDGRLCGCGQRGCWETYASGSALAEKLRASGVELSGPKVTDAARAGDPLVVAAIEEIGHWLGIGLASLCAVLDPSLILVGGGVSDAGELVLAPLRSTFAERLSGGARRPAPEIRLAELGVDAGVIGAAALADEHARS